MVCALFFLLLEEGVDLAPCACRRDAIKLGVRNEKLGGYGKHKLSLIIRKRLKGMKLMVHLWKFAFDENIAR